MNFLIDKLIIFITCFSVFIYNVNDIYRVTSILIVIFFGAINSYLDNSKVTNVIFIFFLCLCFYNSSFLFFMPLMSYDLFLNKTKYLSFLLIIPLSTLHISILSKFLIITFIFISYILKSRSSSLDSLKKDYYDLKDTSKELSIKFEKNSKELLEKQDYEIKLATLKERNRIARDIHDNVGHLLSRSILQIGAAIIINKNEELNLNLNLIKDTLNEAMNSIRNSVHDLHDDSIDLQIEIQKLINNFSFCTVNLNYNIISSLEQKLKYTFITIIKEAFANIIKHSNATKVDIYLNEHPAFYQLIVKDNGSNITYNKDNGIGLQNIRDRVTALNGSLNISVNDGFRIFISIPKL